MPSRGLRARPNSIVTAGWARQDLLDDLPHERRNRGAQPVAEAYMSDAASIRLVGRQFAPDRRERE